jgi:hypothetical protein
MPRGQVLRCFARLDGVPQTARYSVRFMAAVVVRASAAGRQPPLQAARLALGSGLLPRMQLLAVKRWAEQ